MIKKWTALSFILLLSTMLFLMVGCSDDDDVITGANGDLLNTIPLFATWTQSSVSIDGVQQDLATFFEWSVGTETVYVIVHSDSTYNVNEVDASDSTLYTESGIIAINGSNLVLTMTTSDGVDVTPEINFDGAWAVTGDTLTLTATVEGHAIIITMTKITT